MEAQIRSRVSAFEPDVIVEDELGQANSFLGSGRSFFAGRGWRGDLLGTASPIRFPGGDRPRQRFHDPLRSLLESSGQGR